MLTYKEWTKVFSSTNLNHNFLFSNQQQIREEVEKFLTLMGASARTIRRCVQEDTNPSIEEIDMIKQKYNTEDLMILMNDRGSVDDKILFFMASKGMGTLDEIIQFLDNQALFLPTSRRNLERKLDEMVSRSFLERTQAEESGEEFKLRVLPPTRAVTLGKRLLSSDYFEILGECHLGIKICDSSSHPLTGAGTWTEGLRSGSTFLIDSDTGNLPFGFAQPGVNSVTGTKGFQFLGLTAKTDPEIELWKREYLRANPTYGPLNTCIEYARELSMFLGTPAVI